jgi:hypothetical protein
MDVEKAAVFVNFVAMEKNLPSGERYSGHDTTTSAYANQRIVQDPKPMQTSI